MCIWDRTEIYQFVHLHVMFWFHSCTASYPPFRAKYYIVAILTGHILLIRLYFTNHQPYTSINF